MCGIAGSYGYRDDAPPVDEAALLRIRDAMARRGPDGAGLWIDAAGRIGLAHRRLAVIDTSAAGAQPMATCDGRYHITFNGEIYNHRALHRELQGRGFRFRSHSDTEVLLALYADCGSRMLERLRGMYAFAIWDALNRTLFLARDPLGIKPIYYADDGRTLRFASQVQALLKSGTIAATPEPAGYVGYYVWGSVPEPHTLYREVRALPAGCAMTVRPGRCGEPARHFDLCHSVAAAGGDVDLVDELRRSVQAHLESDVPVGVFLSAGLDSTTLAALAAGALARPLTSLTLGLREYVGTTNDETVLAEAVAERYGTRHTTHWITRTDFEAELDALLAAMDQPSIDGVNTYFISKAAAAAGMKVALSGIGGDELFGGYPSFADVPRVKRLAGALATLPSLSKGLRRTLAPVARLFTSPKYAGMFEYGGTYGGAYLLRRGLFMPWELHEVLDPDFAAEGWQRLATLPALQASIEGLTAERQIVAALELSWYMRNQLLRDSDWAGMAHSVEIRLPYVDVPFFRAVMPLLAQSRPPQKTDLAMRLAPAMVGEVLRRNKTGFIVPLREWCMQRGGVRERGLRGWAKLVMARCGNHPPPQISRARRRACAGLPSRRGEVRWRASAPASSASPHHRLHELQARAACLAYRRINGALAVLAAALWRGPRPDHATRVCLFRIGSIGDITCALPAMQAVRRAYPEATLTLLTSPGPVGRPGAADLHAGLPWIDEIILYHSPDIETFPQRWSLLRSLRERRFDVWVELPNNLSTISRQVRDMAFTRLLGVRWARGWQIGTLRHAAQAQSEYLEFPNEVERLLGIVESAGYPAGAGAYAISLPAPARCAVDDLLGTSGGKTWVALAPAAKRSTNHWPLERFVEVARAIVGRGEAVVVLGGAGDRELCETLVRHIGAGAVSGAGRLSVLASCEVLRRSRFLIGVDSGVQHLAAAVGTPCISLFSFWQMFGKWRPHGARHRVLQKWVSCHTCLLNECPHENRCMTAITVPEVLDAAYGAQAA